MWKQNDDYWYLNHKLPVTTHKPTTEIKFTQNPINFATGGDDGARTQRKPRNWTGQRPNIRLPPTHVTVTVTSQRVRKLSGIHSPPKPNPTWQSNLLWNTQKVSERLGKHKTRKTDTIPKDIQLWQYHKKWDRLGGLHMSHRCTYNTAWELPIKRIIKGWKIYKWKG